MEPPLNSDSERATTPWSPYRYLALVAGPLCAATLLVLPPPDGMGAEAWTLVALAAWMVIWWLSEAIPIPATALLPLAVMPVLSLGDMAAVASNYADPVIFLFLSGFLMAEAMKKWGLHRRIALAIVSRVGHGAGSVIGGFMVATAFLSMWISNTSATIMMFAVAVSVIDLLADSGNRPADVRRFGVALMLGIAYSATIGGVGTLIGTPPNALLASFLKGSYGIEIDFVTWMQFGVPIVVVMLPLAWLLLTKLVFPTPAIQIEALGGVVRSELGAGKAPSRPEKVVAAVYLCTALAWISRKQLVAVSGLPITDTTIALAAALVLFMWPVSRRRRQFVLEWQDTRDIPWGILLLFGGGLALAEGFDNTGLAAWIGNTAVGFDAGPYVMILAVAVLMIYMTEITSNTASTATFLPVLGAAAIGMQLDPRLLTIPAAVAASMAFMMPVATPPNAIVFAYRDMHLSDMVRAGFLLNLVAIVVTFAAMYLLAGPVFSM